MKESGLIKPPPVPAYAYAFANACDGAPERDSATTRYWTFTPPTPTATHRRPVNRGGFAGCGRDPFPRAGRPTPLPSSNIRDLTSLSSVC